MTGVDAVGFGTATGAVAAEAPPTPQDEFLRMLVAQLEHQDPLAPQDSAQFVAQLAQFTQVEQTAETNVRLGQLEEAEAAGLRSSFANIVGREVTANANRVVVDNGKLGESEYLVHLDRPAEKVEIIVRNDAGDEVARFEESNLLAGDTPITWNGLNSHGVAVADGDYTFEVSAEDKDGEPIDAHTRMRGRVTAIDFEGGNIKFTLGGAEITPAEILAIAE